MEKKDKPLPRPSRSRRHPQDEQEQLLSDRMAAAIAAGKLESFLKEELPDNEHARSLAMMMLGMSGMAPAGMAETGTNESNRAEPASQGGPSEEPPEDVLQAVHSGNVQDLMGLLQREHRKRTGEPEESGKQQRQTTAELSAEEGETLAALVQIAEENKVSIDWIVLRALKLYIQEFRRTGRL